MAKIIQFKSNQSPPYGTGVKKPAGKWLCCLVF